MPTDASTLKKSVTAADYADRGGALFLAVGAYGRNNAGFPPGLEGLSLRESDYVTSTTVDQEAIWAGAVAIAITKVSSLSWEIEGDIPLRTKRAHELLMTADAGRGWVSFISKIVQDFLLTNNGTFIEIVRATSSPNSQIIGLIPLDSLRCTRTGDPERPIIYADLKGRLHELRAADVIEFADMPSSRASMFGSGRCAASRAYKSIYKLANIESYISDKVSGRRPLAVHLVNGLNDLQLRSVLNTAQAEADARGAIAYMGAIMATIPGDTTPGIATIPLADFPDNFDRSKELDITVLGYANNLGLDVQDLQPLTGRALGTGAQSEVLDEKAKGKGLAAFRQQFTHALNQWVLPDTTTMVFIERDWRDKLQEADYNTKTGAYVSDSVTAGVITAGQGLQALVDANVYPKEFLTVDQTPDDTLSDTEKPMEEPLEEPVPAPVTVEIPEVIAKEARAAVELVGQIEKELELIRTEKTVTPLEQKLDRLIELMTSQREAGVLQRQGNVMISEKDGGGINITVPPPQVTVNIPEQPPAQITVNVPEQPAAQVTVNVPAQAAPIVNLTARIPVQPVPPAPIVNITPEITVTMPEKPKGEFIVNRDNFGNVLGIEEK